MTIYQESTMKIFKLLLLTSSLTLSTFGYANTTDITKEYVAPEETKQQVLADDIERIGVTSKVPLLYFKRQAMLAELDFYESFNAIADNEQFKMRCRKEARVGSRIKETRCYPQYLLQRMSLETQDALSSGKPYPTWEEVEFLVQRDKKASLIYAEELIAKNPELLAKLETMQAKQQEYLNKRSEKFK
jgi:hypothetical protein